MKTFSLIVFYLIIITIGILSFFAIRWFVIHENPAYYENTRERVLSTEEKKQKDLNTESIYFEVTKKQVLITAEKFPNINKEVKYQTKIINKDLED